VNTANQGSTMTMTDVVSNRGAGRNAEWTAKPK